MHTSKNVTINAAPIPSDQYYHHDEMAQTKQQESVRSNNYPKSSTSIELVESSRFDSRLPVEEVNKTNVSGYNPGDTYGIVLNKNKQASSTSTQTLTPKKYMTFQVQTLDELKFPNSRRALSDEALSISSFNRPVTSSSTPILRSYEPPQINIQSLPNEPPNSHISHYHQGSYQKLPVETIHNHSLRKTPQSPQVSINPPIDSSYVSRNFKEDDPKQAQFCSPNNTSGTHYTSTQHTCNSCFQNQSELNSLINEGPHFYQPMLNKTYTVTSFNPSHTTSPHKLTKKEVIASKRPEHALCSQHQGHVIEPVNSKQMPNQEMKHNFYSLLSETPNTYYASQQNTCINQPSLPNNFKGLYDESTFFSLLDRTPCSDQTGLNETYNVSSFNPFHTSAPHKLTKKEAIASKRPEHVLCGQHQEYISKPVNSNQMSNQEMKHNFYSLLSETPNTYYASQQNTCINQPTLPNNFKGLYDESTFFSLLDRTPYSDQTGSYKSSDFSFEPCVTSAQSYISTQHTGNNSCENQSEHNSLINEDPHSYQTMVNKTYNASLFNPSHTSSPHKLTKKEAIASKRPEHVLCGQHQEYISKPVNSKQISNQEMKHNFYSLLSETPNTYYASQQNTCINQPSLPNNFKGLYDESTFFSLLDRTPYSDQTGSNKSSDFSFEPCVTSAQNYISTQHAGNNSCENQSERNSLINEGPHSYQTMVNNTYNASSFNPSITLSPHKLTKEEVIASKRPDHILCSQHQGHVIEPVNSKQMPNREMKHNFYSLLSETPNTYYASQQNTCINQPSIPNNFKGLYDESTFFSLLDGTPYSDQTGSSKISGFSFEPCVTSAQHEKQGIASNTLKQVSNYSQANSFHHIASDVSDSTRYISPPKYIYNNQIYNFQDSPKNSTFFNLPNQTLSKQNSSNKPFNTMTLTSPYGFSNNQNKLYNQQHSFDQPNLDPRLNKNPSPQDTSLNTNFIPTVPSTYQQNIYHDNERLKTAVVVSPHTYNSQFSTSGTNSKCTCGNVDFLDSSHNFSTRDQKGMPSSYQTFPNEREQSSSNQEFSLSKQEVDNNTTEHVLPHQTIKGQSTVYNNSWIKYKYTPNLTFVPPYASTPICPSTSKTPPARTINFSGFSVTRNTSPLTRFGKRKETCRGYPASFKPYKCSEYVSVGDHINSIKCESLKDDMPVETYEEEITEMYDSSEREVNNSLMCKILRGEIGRILVWPSPEQKTANTINNAGVDNNANVTYSVENVSSTKFSNGTYNITRSGNLASNVGNATYTKEKPNCNRQNVIYDIKNKASATCDVKPVSYRRSPWQTRASEIQTSYDNLLQSPLDSYSQERSEIYNAPESNIDDSLLARVVRGEISKGIVYPTPPEKVLGNSNNQMSAGNKTRLKSVTLKKISTPSKGRYAQEITETYEAVSDDRECVTKANCSGFSVPPSVRGVPANFLHEAATPVSARAKETAKNRTSSPNLDAAYNKVMVLRNLKKWQEARRKLVLDTTKISTIGPTMSSSSGHSK